MSLWKRVKNLIAKPEPVQQEKSPLTLGPGDVCEVSLVTYEVIGSVQNRQRSSVMLTLRDGALIRYLSIEERENTVYALYTPIDGRLDNMHEIPTVLELDDCTYHMEEQYEGMTTANGKTPFHTGGEQSVWQYQADNFKLLRIEWQDGRFMLYEGETIITADVRVIRGR
ncbi:DUF4178 domain-containing protein [Paenibacillus sp. GCM10012307]|uniref:DUF4178 domain-containing protein n=1 Tax=Paenibacillus roseus TaxID=2798579 RepID=A0A934MSF0_9BACL|nr:DUF4178 domain-containing protein [Paenibacillus roseus]MBJ6363204.1 DUF4178 domain-containing protein [Paenibacillus roseus]